MKKNKPQAFNVGDKVIFSNDVVIEIETITGKEAFNLNQVEFTISELADKRPNQSTNYYFVDPQDLPVANAKLCNRLFVQMPFSEKQLMLAPSTLAKRQFQSDLETLLNE